MLSARAARGRGRGGRDSLDSNAESWFTSCVPYRPTERTEARKAVVRKRIVSAARELIAHGGYAEAQVATVAARAGVATGTVYRHFPSKAELFAEGFPDASQREVDAVAAAAAESGDGAPARTAATHEVLNQPPPLEGYNVFERDAVLVEALRREGGDWARDDARALGAICGRPDMITRGVQANENPPRLRTHDRFGNRIDEVEFHPAWHELMRLGISHGLHASPWRDPRPGAHVARAAKFILLSQIEAGVGCPISMTYSVIPAIRRQPEVA